MDSSRFLSLVAGLFFLAGCAWFGSAVYNRASAPEIVPVRYVEQAEEAELEGIVLRREQTIQLPRWGDVLVEDGSRVPAGGRLAGAGDSELLSPCSGVYLKERDGFEDLGPQHIDPKLSPRALDRLLEQKPQRGRGQRLVTGRAWYYWAHIEKSHGLPPEGSCQLRFEGCEEPLEARLLAVSGEEEGRRTVLLRLIAGDPGSLSLRKCKAELLYGRHEGLLLPDEGLHTDEEGQSYVYILSMGLAKKVPVDVIYTGAGHHLARESRGPEGLGEGSSLILGEDIYEGKVLIS